MMIFAELLTLAKKTSVQLLDATSTWDSTTTHNLTCPTGKRWFLLNCFVWRTQAATLSINHRNAADAIIAELVYSAAAVGGVGYPNGIGATRSVQSFYPLRIDAGEYIGFVFSVAQDATAYISYSILEVDL